MFCEQQHQIERGDENPTTKDEDIFHDCVQEENDIFYDTNAYQNIAFDIKKNYKKPFHLKINHTQLMKGESLHQYIKQDIVDEWLESVSYDELIGNHTAFESLAFAISTVDKLQQLEELQPKLA